MSSSASLEPFIYPLKGSLRFEVEDIETLGKGPRYSKSIKVGKTEWCISVETECSDRTVNVPYLGVYLRNLYNFDEQESVEVKDLNRMLHEDNSKVITKSCNTSTYNNKCTSLGWTKFIEKTKLMNEGYVKNGTITIECDFEVLSEKIHEKDNFFEQSRPNKEDIRKMLSIADYIPRKKQIEMEIETSQVSTDTYCSQLAYIDRVPCKIEVEKSQKNNEKLGIYLFCNKEDTSEWWGVEATAEFKIFNQDDSNKTLSGSFVPCYFTREDFNCGYIFNWKEVFNLANGYVKYGRICIAVTVYIRNKYGFDDKTGKGIEKPMKKITDAVIEVEGTKFHVSRMILSHQSSWFTEMFSKDPKTSEFAFSDVTKKYFTMFLQLVYNKPLVLDETDLSSLLELFDKYRAEECIKRLDHQLIGMEVKDDMKMLKLIDKYGLPNMKARYVVKYQDMNSMKKLLKDPNVVKLSDELREALTLDEIPIQEEDDRKPFYEYSKHAKTTEKLTGPKEMFQKHLKENPEAKKLLENPELQNIGNSVLSFLSQLSPENPSLLSYREFSDPSDMVTINFKDNKIFYSSKQILANASEYFMKKYFGLDAKDDDNTLIFDEISSKDFNTIMNHIYHPNIAVSESNLDILLPLAHRFGVTDVLTKCENYLIKAENLSIDQKEEYAKKYNLEYLLSACRNNKEKKTSNFSLFSYLKIN